MTTPAVARWTLFAAMALAAANPAAAADANLLAAARAAQPAVIESLREMVLMESGSHDAAGLKSMADYLDARLRALGASTERTKAGVGPGELGKGTFVGTGKRNFLLIAHMDTVYPKGILATEPYRQDENKLYGPGIADDKGGIAVILGRAARQGGRRAARARYRDHRHFAGRPPALCRRHQRHGAGHQGAGHLRRTRRAQAHPSPQHRRRHRCRLCRPLGQGRGTGKPGPGRLGLPRKNEYIEIDSIAPRLYLTTRLLNDLARE
jgi:Peptidase family M20/M25/M40